MQAITFLVTLAEAAASDDPTIVEQIPKELHKSRTLLLCPPTLIENWRDEWNQWQPSTKPVGEVRTTNNSATRLDNIRAWYNEGGVLIVSYDLVRSPCCLVFTALLKFDCTSLSYSNSFTF